jgi:hypothetical protein
VQVGGDQAGVVRVCGEQVAHAEVACLDAVLPRDPVRGHERVRAGEEDYLADRDVRLGAGRRDGDGPAPAVVAGLVGLEHVGYCRVVLYVVVDVRPHALVARLFLRGGAREVDLRH